MSMLAMVLAVCQAFWEDVVSNELQCRARELLWRSLAHQKHGNVLQIAVSGTAATNAKVSARGSVWFCDSLPLGCT